MGWIIVINCCNIGTVTKEEKSFVFYDIRKHFQLSLTMYKMIDGRWIKLLLVAMIMMIGDRYEYEVMKSIHPDPFTHTYIHT